MNTINIEAIGAAIQTQQCVCCEATIEHLGDVVIKMCDECLDILEGTRPVKIQKRMMDHEDWTPIVLADDCGEDAAASGERDVYVRPIEDVEASPIVLSETKSQKHTHICNFCVNATTTKCKCDKLVCYTCCDEETGLCPDCDE